MEEIGRSDKEKPRREGRQFGGPDTELEWVRRRVARTVRQRSPRGSESQHDHETGAAARRTLSIPLRFGDRELNLQQVRLIDFLPRGARIEHPDSLNAGLMCFIDLPPAGESSDWAIDTRPGKA